MRNNQGFANILVISLVIVLIAIGGYFGYSSYLAPKTDSAPIDTGPSNEEILKKELEKKDEEIKNITNKVDEIQKQLNDYQSQIDSYKKQLSSKDSEISDLKKEVSSKDSNLDKLSSSLSKQEACNKKNEYSQLSSDLKFRTNGESGGNGCSTSYALNISSNTENAFEYINAWYENYKSTGSVQYKFSPDICLYDVEKLFSKLKDRRDKYREYKKKCENK